MTLLVEVIAPLLALLLLVYFLYRTFFGPALAYKVRTELNLADPETAHRLAVLLDGSLHEHNRLEVLNRGADFYSSELEAIHEAQSSITVEAYIFIHGTIAERFVQCFCAKAREGVRVHLLLDAFGSAGMALRRGLLRRMRKAGVEVRFYRPVHFQLLELLNVRTHREIVVVDGRVAFVGGAGFADHWYRPTDQSRPWRDLMLRVEGPAVAAIQGVFVEHWTEAASEILTGERYFPGNAPAGSEQVIVVNSSARGRATQARILYHVLLASAHRSIAIATPYFLPDPAIREELTTALARGVAVTILTTGQKSDHTMTRSGGRRLYGELLRAGARIFEYQPGMLHAKVMLVDDRWSVVGTTNLDYRSFGINDEINLVIPEPSFHDRLARDFARDIQNSLQIDLRSWRMRPLYERCWEQVSRLLERQQ